MSNVFVKMCTKFYQYRSSFVDDVTKTFWCVFFGSQFQLRTFTKRVAWDEIVYVTVWKIYSRQYRPNFIRIGYVLRKMWQKHVGVFLRLTL